MPGRKADRALKIIRVDFLLPAALRQGSSRWIVEYVDGASCGSNPDKPFLVEVAPPNLAPLMVVDAILIHPRFRDHLERLPCRLTLVQPPQRPGGPAPPDPLAIPPVALPDVLLVAEGESDPAGSDRVGCLDPTGRCPCSTAKGVGTG